MMVLTDYELGLLTIYLHYRGGVAAYALLQAELPSIHAKLTERARLDDYEKSLLVRFVLHRLDVLALAGIKAELPELFNRLAGRAAVKSVNVCFCCQQAPCHCPDSTHAEA
jgi:hypothetical protein